jgi:hypothetical protein
MALNVSLRLRRQYPLAITPVLLLPLNNVDYLSGILHIGNTQDPAKKGKALIFSAAAITEVKI